ncbi:hypothetical protein GCM10023085_25390 [Actinomadura viridis]
MHGRASVQLGLQLRELRLVQPRPPVRALGPQRLRAALTPGLPPFLHLPQPDPQLGGDPRVGPSFTEPLRGLHPHLFSVVTADDGQPGALGVSGHAPAYARATGPSTHPTAITHKPWLVGAFRLTRTWTGSRPGG